MSASVAVVYPMATRDPEIFGLSEKRYLELRAWIGALVSTDILEAVRTKALLFNPFSWMEKIYPKTQDVQEALYVTFELTMTCATVVQRMTDPKDADETFDNLMRQAWFIADHFKIRHGIEELTDEHATTVKDFILEKMTADYAHVKEMERVQEDMPKSKGIIGLDQQ